MSETQDLLIYNFYDYMKSIFIYSHIKTYLIDPDRQYYEKICGRFLTTISLLFVITVFIKIFIIFVYFFILQFICALISFIKNFKLKACNKSSWKNAWSFIKKTFKRFFTYNFYLYENNVFGGIIVFAYFFYLICSLHFYIINEEQVQSAEKTEKYMYFFYLHFESIVLIQILCSSFYAVRNLKIAFYSAIIIFILLNAILIIVYAISETIENVDGKFEFDDPQKAMNILFNTIFLLLNGNCFYNLLTFKQKGK